MSHVRVVPRLDIKGPNLVKGIHLEGLRVLGSPGEFARLYYEQGADELIMMDVVASLYERNSLHDIISAAARDAFIPITVGGGLRNIEDIRNVLNAGADKVAINTAAVKRPAFVSEAAVVFGCSTIVVAIESIKQSGGEYYAFMDNGRERTEKEVVSWAQQVEELGAGEIMITSVDREGTGEGYDLELVQLVASSVRVPVVAHGGAGRKEHIREVAQAADVSAVAAASIYHYRALADGSVEGGADASTEGNVEFIKRRTSFSRIAGATLNEVKRELLSAGVDCHVREPSE